MRSSVILAIGTVALGVVTVIGQQAVPPPTVVPPVVPTTTPVGPARGVGTRSPAPTARSTSAVIIGQVVDGSGRGVPKAAVRLIGDSVIETVLTDPKGRFFFRSIPPGEAIVTAQKFGYFDGGFGKRRAGGNPLPFTLSTSQVIADMRIEVFRGAVITGSVVDEAGEPIIGARVVALRRQFAEGVWQYVAADSDLTDDEGFYRIFGLQPGEYIVSAPATTFSAPLSVVEAIGATGESPGGGIALLILGGAPGDGGGEKAAAIADRARVTPDGRDLIWANTASSPDEAGRAGIYPSQFYPATEHRILAMPMTLVSGDVHYAVNFRLPLVPARRVSGRLISDVNRAANQLVRLVPVGGDGAIGDEAAVTVSRPDGTFAFPRVPAGHYRLDAGNPGSPESFWGRTDVVVSDADIEIPDVELHPVVEVTGHIVFESAKGSSDAAPPVTRIPITIVPVAGGASSVARLEAGGAFAARDLIPGEYFVRVGTLPAGFFLKSITAAGRNAMDDSIDVAEGGLDSVVVTVTTRGAQVSGSVRDGRMQAVAGATVIIMPVTTGGGAVWTPNRTRETRASTNGVFFASGLPAGEYLIVAIDDAVAEGWQDPAMIAKLRTLATRITLADGEFKSVQLRLR